MRRVSALACICASLVALFSLACPAAELHLSAGVELQGGRRTFTALDCDFVWDFGVSVPAVRYSFGASGEHLSLNGYWDGGETTDASVDPAFAAGHTKYQGDSYGRSNAWGCDLGYRWSAEALEVGAVAGYRYACFAAGARQTAMDPRDLRTHTYAFGLEAQGARLGVSAAVRPAPRLRVAATVGYSPDLTVAEVRDELAEGGSSDGSADTVNRRLPAAQDSWTADAGLQAEYSLSERAAVLIGYEKEWGRFTFDPGAAAPGTGCLGELYRVRAARWVAGLRARF